MGLAVKHDAAVWMLKAYDWSVSWNAKVDENLNGAGEAVNSSAIKDIIKDGPDTSLTDWSLTAKHDAFEGFSTVEEAMKRSPDELLKWIFAAKAHDQVTYRNICAALDAKDPTFSVKVECETTKDLVGRDHVHIRAEGGNSGASAGKTVKLKKGESDTIGLTMKELFGSAGGISSGAKLKVEVQHLDGPEGSAEFGAPFAGSKKIAVDSGSYTATVSLG